MNAPIASPATGQTQPAARRARADHEFLPAALEILETPASPVRLALILVIASLWVAGVAWAIWGQIDIVAVAAGKVQPTGRVKLIEPLVTGKVVAIPVENGRQVREGDLLLALDATEAEADRDALTTNLAALRAELARRHAALAALDHPGGPSGPAPEPAFAPDLAPAIRAREKGVLAGDLAELAANLAGLEARSRQSEATRARLAGTIAVKRDLIATLKERVAMRDELVDRHAGARSAVLDALERAQREEAELSSDRGQITEAEASLAVLAREMVKARESFRAEQLQKIAEAERQADELAERRAKAQALVDHLRLTAPIAGMVQALAVSTVGEVVTTGEEVMRLVPQSSSLEVEVYLANKDIGFVHPGQPATIKIETFPFTRYGTIKGTVSRVAADAIPEPEARAAEGDALRRSERGLDRAAPPMRNLVFPVTIKLSATRIVADGTEVPLSPGMAVTAEIKTGQRRILDYLFSPLTEVTSDAMRER
jgi:hemolysin D